MPEVTARDAYDGDVDVDVVGFIGDDLGVYELAYTSTDNSANTTQIALKVFVVDEDPPTISLNGDSAMILAFFSDFDDPGATAIDNYDGVLSEGNLTVTIFQNFNGKFTEVAEVSTNFPAEYHVNYQYEDSSGNTSSVSRSIIVSPPEGEKITILEDGVLGAYWDSGIQAFDQDLNWGACTVPAGCPNIDWGFVDDDERGSVLEVTHADTSAGAGIFISSSDPIDIRDAEEDGFIKLDLKVVEGDQTIIFKADCGYPCGGGDQYVDISELNKWQTVIVPVKSLIPFGPSGNVLDLEILKAGLVIQALSAKATTFRIDNAYYDCRAATCAGISVPFVPVDWEANHEDPNDPEAFVAPTSYPGYALAWSDEFDGDSVNSDNWSFDIGNGDNGWGNGELQYYREDNASVDDGLLIIEAQKHVPPIDLPQKTGNRFTSSKLISEDKIEFKYGRVDIRAVVAEGQGMWSAGWMLGANTAEIGWPYSGEIDIFDTIGGSASKHGSNQEGMIVNNMYWNSTGPDPSEPLRAQGINNNGNAEYRINTSNEGETFSNRFHVFSLIWDEDSIKFEVDGVNTNNDVALVGALAQTYRNPFYLILNVAIGGAWPKSPDTTTEFPDGMLVDYVRVYQTDSDGNGIPDFELDGETPKN
jgi:beta-glucanase (GH16 family)